jgi:hypothetical protein
MTEDLPTEHLPHVVYSATYPHSAVAYYEENFKAAKARWDTVHSYKTPFLIRTCMARSINPADHIGDPSE